MTNQGNSAVVSVSSRWNLSSVVLGTGFCLTGAGTVMLGVLLPTLSQRWGMRDDAAGFLLFLQFIGSSLGAILTGARRVRSITIGYGLLVVSACALAFAGESLSFATFVLFGLGLGMTMTATSLLISDRYGDDRAAKLERLNFAWAAGATVAPVLFTPFLRRSSLGPLFFSFQGLFLLLFLWVIFRERQNEIHEHSNAEAQSAQNSGSLLLLLPLVAMAMCSVGVESSLSGWLTTYSHRADLEDVSGAAFAASLFWFGIVLSRLIFSTRLLALVGRYRLLRVLLWCVAASVALLIASRHTAPIRASAALAGLCIGPVYPLLLSFILQRSPRGWVFAVAGIGSALVPWLTGLCSAHFGSLRYGLVVPCATAVMMIVLFVASLRPDDSSQPRLSSNA